MNKMLLFIAFLGIIAANVSAQNIADSTNNAVSDFLSQVIKEQNSNAYERSGWTVGFVNTRRESFDGAQIGFINTVTSKSRGAQVGFVNTVNGSFNGTQVAFVNTATSDSKGAQVGFFNTVNGRFNGAQVAFINTATNDTKGAQVGFINTVRGSFNGTQVSFINTATKDSKGAQVGFINTVRGDFDGGQVGFINTTTKEIDGAQIGFINTTRRLSGLQLGFVNFADEIENGTPIGFLSIVRRGGYRAVELSSSEFHVMNVGFKIGIERFYTTFSVGFNPFEEHTSKRFAAGAGFGTIIPMGDSFFFNPEISSLSSLESNSRNLTSFVPYFGYNLSERFSITAAPSVTWSFCSRDADLLEPVYCISNFEIDDRNEIIMGARVGVRWRF